MQLYNVNIWVYTESKDFLRWVWCGQHCRHSVHFRSLVCFVCIFGLSACLVLVDLSFCWMLFPESSIILLPYGWGQKSGYRHSLRLMTILAVAPKPLTSNLAIHPKPLSWLPLLPVCPLVSPRSIFSLQHGTCLLVIHQSALYPQQDQPPLGKA